MVAAPRPAPAGEILRIVAVADTHLFENDLVMPPGDIFIHAGDMCRTGDINELRLASKWIASLPYKHKIIVAGNHDWAFVHRPLHARLLFSGSHYLEDESTTIEGLHFWGSPWQPEFCNWAFNLPRGVALEEVWERMPADLDVLITHGPPHGFGDSVAGEKIGCDNLIRYVRKRRPRLHIFGHNHGGGGAWREGQTLLTNVTTAEATRQPTVIDFNRVTRHVTPVTIPRYR